MLEAFLGCPVFFCHLLLTTSTGWPCWPSFFVWWPGYSVCGELPMLVSLYLSWPDQSPQKGHSCLLPGGGGLAPCSWRESRRGLRSPHLCVLSLLGPWHPALSHCCASAEACTLPLKGNPDFAGWYRGSNPVALYWRGSPGGSYCFLNSFWLILYL